MFLHDVLCLWHLVEQAIQIFLHAHLFDSHVVLHEHMSRLGAAQPVVSLEALITDLTGRALTSMSSSSLKEMFVKSHNWSPLNLEDILLVAEYRL